MWKRVEEKSNNSLSESYYLVKIFIFMKKLKNKQEKTIAPVINNLRFRRATTTHIFARAD